MSIELVMLSKHLILCCSLLFLSSIFPSIRVYSNESELRISWPKYWRFNFSISPFNEYSGLISFRIRQFAGVISQLLHVTLYLTLADMTFSLWESPKIPTCFIVFETKQEIKERKRGLKTLLQPPFGLELELLTVNDPLLPKYSCYFSKKNLSKGHLNIQLGKKKKYLNL